MSILRYEDINAAIGAGQLLTNAEIASIQPSSYDMRIGTIFRDGQIINGQHADRDRQFNILPGELVSIFTLEEVVLPPNIAGFAFAMNAWSSQGLLVLNPGHVDPGYSGPLTVKALNLRKTPISLALRLPIFTIVFFKMDQATTHPYDANEPDRRRKEQGFNSTEQERTPASLADLLRHSQDLPMVSSEAMDQAVRKHWMSVWSLILTAAAAITGILGLIVALSVANQNRNLEPRSNIGTTQSLDSAARAPSARRGRTDDSVNKSIPVVPDRTKPR